MVKPSDFSAMHGRFPPSSALSSTLREASFFSRSGSDSGLPWVLNLPPAEASFSEAAWPTSQLAFRRRPCTSSAYARAPPASEPCSPPKSLQFAAAVDLPLAKWRPAQLESTYNILSPAQRSLSTSWGTSASDPAGAGWSSQPGTPARSLRSTTSWMAESRRSETRIEPEPSELPLPRCLSHLAVLEPRRGFRGSPFGSPVRQSPISQRRSPSLLVSQ